MGDLQDAAELREILQKIDTDGSGSLSLSELDRMLSNERIRSQLCVLGLDFKDAEAFFGMLAQIGYVAADFELDIEFFIETLLKMKGGASGLDLQAVAFETKVIHQRVERSDEVLQSILHTVSELQRNSQRSRPEDRTSSSLTARHSNAPIAIAPGVAPFDADGVSGAKCPVRDLHRPKAPARETE